MGAKHVEDKVYRIAKVIGVKKCWLPDILMVSSTTLYRWSYNPLNVSPTISDDIYRRIAILDRLGIRVGTKVIKEWSQLAKPPKPVEYTVAHVDGLTYYMKPTTRRLPGRMPDCLLAVLRNAIFYEEEQEKKRFRSALRHDGPCCMVARDKSLEMPLGVLRWDPDLLPK